MVKDINEPKQYVSVSTRLPSIDANLLNFICEKQSTTPSEYIRELIQKSFNSPQKRFLAGRNKIRYNKTDNSFSWIVELDQGEKIEIVRNLSDDFLNNLKHEIDDAIKQRNLWIHQTKPDSIGVPGELVK